MKKLNYLFLIIFMAMFLLIGCSNASNPNENETSSNKIDTTEQKVQLYQRIQGTYESTDSDYFHIFVFAMDSITLDGTKYPFNPLQDLYLEDEIPENERYYQQTFYMHFNNYYYPVEFLTYMEPEEEIYITIGDYYRAYKRTSAPAGGGSGSPGSIDFSIVGDWKYNLTASVSTTLSINNDNKFSFTKSSGTGYSGTYQLSANQVTFSYETSTSGVSVKVDDTFTVSGDANQMTLTLVNSRTVTNNGTPQDSTAMSAMLNGFYSIYNSTSVTLEK